MYTPTDKELIYEWWPKFVLDVRVLHESSKLTAYTRSGVRFAYQCDGQVMGEG